MYTLVDEGNGLVKTCWQNIQDRVSKVNPKFTEIVNDLNPGANLPIFLAYYPYGSLIGDTENPFLPNMNSSLFKISDVGVSKEIIKHLDYGRTSLPMGMVLNKDVEYFIDLPKEGITIPWLMYKPGSIFPFNTILGNDNQKSFAPNGILLTSAGARSVFMLPNIGCATNHSRLQRDFNIQKAAPKSLYEHWFIFKEIINSKIIQSNWRCTVLYFSQKWLENIKKDKKWLILKTYLLELAWERFAYERNQVFYDIVFSLIQKNRNLKPNPYLTDTARHLFTIGVGAAPGYAPAIDDSCLPLQILQKTFTESYNLKNHIPTIIQPRNFNFELDKTPVYYSLQNPSTHSFSPKSRKISSTLVEMRELEYIVNIFRNELSKKDSLCSDTVLSKIANILEFNYFHNEKDRHNIIKSSEKIPLINNNFNYFKANKKFEGKFAKDSKFVRGCVSIHVKN